MTTPVNAPPRAEWPVHEERLLKWFVYDHLPADLQTVSKLFHALAHDLTLKLKAGPERTVALRKLLESKDAGIRQAIEDRA